MKGHILINVACVSHSICVLYLCGVYRCGVTTVATSASVIQCDRTRTRSIDKGDDDDDDHSHIVQYASESERSRISGRVVAGMMNWGVRACASGHVCH